jgi:hypothetical protein
VKKRILGSYTNKVKGNREMEYPAKNFRAIIDATFPDNKKRTVRVVAQEQVTFYGLNWSGGSKNEYRACTIDGRPIESKYDMSAPAPWNNPFEGKTVSIPVDAVIVFGGFFCGKRRQLTIYVHPQNMPKWIEAGKGVEE